MVGEKEKDERKQKAIQCYHLHHYYLHKMMRGNMEKWDKGIWTKEQVMVRWGRGWESQQK